MILVAGIGNVLRGDDGFGVEVVRRMAARGARDGVSVIDFGIRGFDLAFALSSGKRAAVLVDAAQRGKSPGTLTVLAPDALPTDGTLDTHAMHPLRAIDLARRLGGVPDVMRVVACEPEVLGDDEEPIMGLSPSVEAAVERAIGLIDEIVEELRDA